LFLSSIEGADFIESATVVCGKGGKWQGVVKKGQFEVDDLCLVYLPDAILPPHEDYNFLAGSGWRIKMKRFRKVRSEVLIMPLEGDELLDIGYDVTSQLGVKKYHKPVPANLQGKAVGEFPGFIPRTDEPNYQSVPDLVEMLKDKPYYISEKADGSSTTAFMYKGKFGVCSRNWELERDAENGYWKIAERYYLEDKMPEGFALQWETCGPKIQSNPMGLQEIEGFAFSVYNIAERRYLDFHEFMAFCAMLDFPICRVQNLGAVFNHGFDELAGIAEGRYSNGKHREGIVIRSMNNVLGHKPISFKVINLSYEK